LIDNPMTPEEVLRKAVKERHCQGVKRAFEAKANVNATDDTGWTSLHHTAYHGFGEIVDLLLGHPDIDVTVETPNHETARDLAFIACHDNIASFRSRKPRHRSPNPATPRRSSAPRAARVHCSTSCMSNLRQLTYAPIALRETAGSA
jgi:ankyrin repeat protein